MKNYINQNIIKNDKGASIVLALYFLLFCSVLSSLIILSGSVAAGTNARKEELSQTENILLSCFKLFSGEISGKTFEYTNDESNIYFEQNLKKEGASLLKAYIAEGYQKIQDNENYEMDFEIKTGKMNTKVRGTFFMKNNYEIEITIDQVLENDNTSLSTQKRSIKFSPLNIQHQESKIIVKMGEGELT